MLHSDDVDQKYQDHRFLKMFVRKNRDGRLGKVNYTFYGDYVEFVEKEYVDGQGYVDVQQEDLKSNSSKKIDLDELDELFQEDSMR